jgi:hypothetical protein
LANRHNAYILATRPNQAYFGNPNSLIYSKLLFSYVSLLEKKKGIASLGLAFERVG